MREFVIAHVPIHERNPPSCISANAGKQRRLVGCCLISAEEFRDCLLKSRSKREDASGVTCQHAVQTLLSRSRWGVLFSFSLTGKTIMWQLQPAYTDAFIKTGIGNPMVWLRRIRKVNGVGWSHFALELWSCVWQSSWVRMISYIYI